MTIVPFPPQSGTQVIIPAGVSVRCESFRDVDTGDFLPLAERNNGTFLVSLPPGSFSGFTTLNFNLFNALGAFTAHPDIGWDTYSPVHGALPRRELVLQTNPSATILTYPTPYHNYPTVGPDGSGGTISSIAFGQGTYPIEVLDHRVSSTVTRYWDGTRAYIQVDWAWPTMIRTVLSWDSVAPSPVDPLDPGGSQVHPLRQRERKW